MPGEWIREFDEARAHYDTIRSSNGWMSGPASLLGIIGNRRDEVVHSTILRWLLDPSGGHRLGSTVLQRFLELVPIAVGPRDLASVTVSTEVATLDPESGKHGAIDIVISVPPDLTVIVEVKIWATETTDQLDRYAAAYPGAELVYLTPFGSLPRRSSTSWRRWRPLAWYGDVLPMLRQLGIEQRTNGRPVPALDDYVVALTEELGP